MRSAIFLSTVLVMSGISMAAVVPTSITIDVIPSLAPNAFGSTNFTPYTSNAVTAIGLGVNTYGSGASQYNALADGATLDFRQAVVTGFDSWKGVAAPNTPDYSGEGGNRLTFGLRILGNGTQFSIDNLSFNATSSDSGDALGFGYAGGYGYSSGYVGIDYGADRIKGTADDVVITSGAASQLVDEVDGRGSGNSLPVYTTDPGATLQDKINNAAADFGIDSNFSFTGTYSLGTASGSATVNYNNVPEPTVLGAIITAAGSLLLRRRSN